MPQTQKKLCLTNFFLKQNIREIDTNSQFYQHLRAVFEPISFCQKIKKLEGQAIWIKTARKMLLKMT
jgi:hypothetical protein